jgi:hypothetical protein
MAGTLEITDEYCWMPAGWLFDNVLDRIAAEIESQSSSRAGFSYGRMTGLRVVRPLCLRACDHKEETTTMQAEGVISLWAGQADSAHALDAYLQVGYSDDGDLIPSRFARDFGIRYYDEDFREARHYEKPSRSIRQLLKGYSYDSVIIPKFVQLLGELVPDDTNAVVLLYNFKHEAAIGAKDDGEVRLRYMGAVMLS